MNTNTQMTQVRRGQRMRRAGQAIASVVCLAFMLDCLADEAWPEIS